MGLLSKHKGKGVQLHYFLHVHTLTGWPAKGGSLCVTFQRGKQHSGATRAAAASSAHGADHAAYQFEEQLQLPATLYQDTSKKVRGKVFGPFESKPLQLAVVAADSRGKPASGPPLGTVTLDLADFAATDGRTQRAFSVSGVGLTTSAGAPKLLMTIACRDASHKAGGPLVVEPSSSTLEAEEGMPVSLSTDEEDSSHHDSDADSRPASRSDVLGLRSNSKLAAVKEEIDVAPVPAAPAPAAAGPHGSPGSRWQGRVADAKMPAGGIAGAGAATLAAAAAPQPAVGGRYDEDGFLIDDEVEEAVEEDESAAEAEASLQAGSSVRRNLGSALDRAEASEAASGAAAAASSGQPSEVQSWLAAAGEAAGGAAGAENVGGAVPAFALARRLSSGRHATLTVPSTPAEPLPGEPESPVPYSTDQQSSLSAAGDPAVPFAVPPSTNRRFGQRNDGDAAGGAAAGRRWAWRREGAGGTAAGAKASGAAVSGAGLSTFQRARVVSASKQDVGAAAAAAPEAAGQSVNTSAAVTASQELPSRASTSEERPAAPPPHPPPALSLQHSAGSDGAGLGLRPTSTDGWHGAPRQPLLLQRSLVGASGLLRPTLSLLDAVGLPTPTAPLAGSVPAAAVEALLQELRSLAALESAVYLAGGRRAVMGDASHQLHAPARRMARTIISLGPQEGPAFGLQAISAIQAVAGASAGDMHRLIFWWSNALQLRVQLSTLCSGTALQHPTAAAAGLGAAGGGSTADLDQQASGHLLSPRDQPTATAGASDAGVAGAGLDWMQALLPRLHELESCLFGEMVKHLWWRVLLQSVTAALQRPLSGPGGTPSAAAAAAGPGGHGNGISRSARSAPALAATLSAGSEVNTPASMQGTPRSFETPEEEALQRWVEGLGAVERAIRDPSRPAAAPRAHLALLHRQLIVAVLRRLDTLLFRRLLLDESDDRLALRLPSMGARDAFSRAAEADEVLGGGTEAAAVGLLEPALLPFARGALTFGTGVALKMAVSRLNHWAADCGVKEERLPQAGRSTEMSDYRLFPCLRATADLLMMPKEVLTDPQMRREVVPGLPLHRVCQLLERFEPDDNAPDPLPEGLLEALQSESPRSDGGTTPSPTAKVEEEYQPPAEAALLAEGVIQPMSLAMDEESDDELEALAGLHAQHSGADLDGSGGTQADEARVQRFLLLRDLWASTR